MKALRFSLTAAFAFCLASGVHAENAPVSAQELAGKLAALQQDGNSYVRFKLDIKLGNASKATYQIQVKQRRTANGSEVMYQVLFPRDQKGESVLLRQSGGKASGAIFTPPDKIQNLDGSKMREGLFGSDLSYADAIENFYSWPKQTLVGAEEINGTPCQVLESKGGSSAYGSVKSWIDTRHMVPLKVEKYSSSGQLVRRIDTTNVESDDKGRHLPAGMLVRRGGGETATVIEGSRIKHDVSFSESTFGPEGMKDLSAPR
jgi:outer membrane lipoprotein-sorting protein